MASSASNGYLLIADISGYTSYVATTEIEHSQAVLAELLELLIKHTRPLFTLSKLEGDAIFSYTPQDRISSGEVLLQLVESTYAAFRSRVESILRHTTCECNACRAIPRLDLKFMIHYGQYIRQQVAGIHELLGSDVNLIHRLTKNSVSESTGWHAYALFTEAACRMLDLSTQGLHPETAVYEHLGQIMTHSLNLRERYDEMLATRKVIVQPEESHGHYVVDLPAPPPVVWEWLTDPHKRNLWQPGNIWSAANRPGGRTEIGASNHCAHGKDELAEEIIRDWHPFDYYTVEVHAHVGQDGHPIDNLETVTLESLNDNQHTRATFRCRMLNPSPLSRPLAWVIYNQIMKKGFRLLSQKLSEDGSPL
ncbi:MAG: DUF2652 domain-containing protein [Anaerolineae bacterium]|nr:MAG: DUF2652 domain-containing protein [Anaerolineae bacterium]